MALAAVVNRGTNNNAGSTTITVSPNTTLAVGAFIVVLLTERDWGISSLADNSAQAGTANSYTQNISRLTADPFSYVYSCKLTRSILNTDTITATFAGGSGGKSMTVLLLPDANSSSQFDASGSNAGAAGSTYNTGATGTTAQADEYAVGVMASAASGVNAGTITADSPWTLQQGYVGSGYAAAHGSRVLTATGTFSLTGGWGATMDGEVSGCTATYKGTASGGGTDATVTAAVSTATAAVVAPPLPRPTPPFTEVNVRM